MRRAPGIALRAGVLLGLWWILNEGVFSGWPLIALGVTAALLTGLALAPRFPEVRWGPLLRTVGFFWVQAAFGSLDVARRALSPRMPIDPRVVELSLNIPEGAGRLVFVGALCLMPGTAAIEIRGDCLRLHVLTASADFESPLRRLEALLIRSFPVAGAKHRP